MAGLLTTTAALFEISSLLLMLNFDWMLIAEFAITETIGIGSFYTNMLSFTRNQMIGASAEELSAAVQWYWWGFNISLLIRDGLKCASFPLHFSPILPAIFFCLRSLSYQLFR